MTGFDVGLALALVTSLATALGWYRSATRNQYAREREYIHIIRNLDQQSLAHTELFKELDGVGDRLSRVEMMMLCATSKDASSL